MGSCQGSRRSGRLSPLQALGLNLPQTRPCPCTTFIRGASSLGSVYWHPLQIDELKGTKPTEKIDLSRKGLGVASAIIIASCIKGNGVLKELKCAAAPYIVFAFVSAPADKLIHTLLLVHSIEYNWLTEEAKQTLQDAAGSSVHIKF